MGIKTGKVNPVGQTDKNIREASLLASLARSAEKFTTDKGWREGINALLADLGKITGVSRVWIFQVLEISSEEITQDYTFEWASAPQYVQLGLPVFKRFTNKLGSSEYRKLVESRMRGEWQKVVTSKLPDSFLKESQTDQNIKSMLTIPILVEKEFWGVLGFDDCEREYDWSETEISLLRIASFFIASTVLQTRLSAKEKQFEILRRIVSSGAWEFDVQSGHLWTSAEKFSPYKDSRGNMHLSLYDFLKLVYQEDRRELIKSSSEFFSRGEEIFSHDIRIQDKQRHYYWVQIIGAVGRNSKGRPVKMSGIIVDSDKRKKTEADLKKAAETDSLTGVQNRRVFRHKLLDQIERSRNRKRTFSLLLFDIDHFKEINDTWGHEAGDDVLTHFTDLCLENKREEDSFARIGGDEFALILQDTTEEIGGIAGERICRSVASTPAPIRTDTIPVYVSIGCAEFNGTETADDLLSRADKALYAAKRADGNQTVCYSVMPLRQS